MPQHIKCTHTLYLYCSFNFLNQMNTDLQSQPVCAKGSARFRQVLCPTYRAICTHSPTGKALKEFGLLGGRLQALAR